MTRNLLVDLLLGFGVGTLLACSAGVLLVGSTFDRLHFAAAASSVPAFAILAALLVREGLSTQGLEAIAAVALLFLGSPVVVHATARAARRREFGRLAPLPEEREGA